MTCIITLSLNLKSVLFINIACIFIIEMLTLSNIRLKKGQTELEADDWENPEIKIKVKLDPK